MRTFSLLFLAACGSSPEPAANGPDSAAAEALAGRICSLYGRIDMACEWSGPVATVEGHEYKVDAEVTSEIKVGSSVTMEFAYDLTIDGKAEPALRGQGLGGGASAEAAREQAADDWARVFGTAIIDRVQHTGRLQTLQALQDRQSPPPAFVSGEWVAYLGYTDLRGKRTEDKTIDIQAVLTRLTPLSDAFGEGNHAAYIQFSRAGSAVVEPECTLDGRPSEELCTLVSEYAWPEGSYLLKQYIVFAPGPLPEGINARPDMPEIEARE
ncbi:MAG: hypothetical protein KC912_19140 [Proteobacteria bacterium]|nr:hypothetical protein [Pseudomonadota bacterium]